MPLEPLDLALSSLGIGVGEVRTRTEGRELDALVVRRAPLRVECLGLEVVEVLVVSLDSLGPQFPDDPRHFAQRTGAPDGDVIEEDQWYDRHSHG